MLDSETSGDFGRLIESMLKVGSGEFDACVLHRAMDGAGTDEAEIIDCVVGRCNAELEAISEAYKILYGKDLVSVLKKELSGKFEKLILRVLEGRKEDESANVDDDVKALYNAGAKKLGTDEKMFIAVICGRPTAHIGKIVEGYQSTHHKSLEKVIKSEFTGDLERGLIAVVDSCVDNTERIARSIESTMKGVGTNERKLGTLLIRYRDPSRQAEIKEAYQKKYGRSLSEAISSETSGDFEMLLLALIGN
jgi:annexin A7/11